jgi:hypothetical protein
VTSRLFTRLAERRSGLVSSAAEDRQQGRGGQQRTARTHQHGQRPDQRRTENERRLVGRTLVRECGVDQPRLGVTRLPGQRPPAHSGQRTHLRDRQAGDRGGRDDDRRSGTGPPEGHQGGQRGGGRERLDEDHRTLTDAVRDASGDRRADRVGGRQHSGGEPAGREAAGRHGDEQQGAELAHGKR